MSPDDISKTAQTPIDTAGDAIVAAMSAGGVDHLFFTSGSEIGFYQEAIAKSRALGHNNPVRLVTVPLEHVALNAAIGYAAMTGRPAATAAHVDCGTLHWGGAIHSAWRSGLPVVMTAGFPPTAPGGSMPGSRDEGGHLWMQQTYDQNGIVRQYTKWDHMLAFQDNPGVITSRAIQVARSAPAGPVYLSIPKELALRPVDDPNFPSALELGIPRPSAPDPAFAVEIAERLIKARHPVVVVGNSGAKGETVPALVALAESLGLAVTDGIVRRFLSFPFDHPLYQAHETLAEADVILVLDNDVPWVPNVNGPSDDVYVAAVAEDSVKLRVPTYEFSAERVSADALLTIQAIAAAAEGLLTNDDRARIAKRADALAAVHAARRKELDEAALARAGDEPIDPIYLSHQIGQFVDDDCVVMDDTIGPARLYDYLPCRQPSSYVRSPGSSGGWGVGAALGAKFGAPDKDIIAVTGDGFYMFATPNPALWAAKHHGAPFMSVVYTNRSYTTGTLGVARNFGDDGYAAQSGYEGGYFDPPIDFAKEAEAAGAYGETVTEASEIMPALQRGRDAIRSGTPAVISVWLKRLVDGG